MCGDKVVLQGAWVFKGLHDEPLLMPMLYVPNHQFNNCEHEEAQQIEGAARVFGDKQGSVSMSQIG